GGSNNFKYLTESGKEEYTKGLAVRKAICYAIDRDFMNQVEHDGEYFVCHSVVYPFTAYYYYDGFQYEHDIAKAFEWLAAAGYYEYPTTPSESTTPTPNATIDYSLSILGSLGVISIIMLIFKRRK
ncbi:MAG: ABC transporter substrate-binding protein, partial [Candidatus Heimdallarchaeaceae archaeon]